MTKFEQDLIDWQATNPMIGDATSSDLRKANQVLIEKYPEEVNRLVRDARSAIFLCSLQTKTEQINWI